MPAQSLPPAEARQAVDDKLASLWSAFQNKQTTYAANHGGRFWQGLRTHTVNPSDGDTALPNIGTTCPTDQQGDPWPVAIRNTPLEMSLQSDVYDGPLGTGYVATVYITLAGNTWTRAAQVGPETWRAYGWRQLTN